MAALAGDGTCIECEALTHWIELQVIDEHNKGFAGIKGLLTDGAGTEYEITLKDGPILVNKLAPGPVTLVLDNETWLAEAQTRKPDDGSDPEIAAELDKNLSKPGNKASVKVLQSVTTGDLIVLEGEQKLPEKHVATGCLSLIADNSYVIKVAGFNYITLRLGVFFDGTGNNTENALNGQQEIEEWLTKVCNDPTELEENLELCREGQLPVEGSYANDKTNVEKLYALYLNQFDEANSQLATGIYVEGIGTTEGESDNILGSAFSLGDTSIKARVEQVCEVLIKDELEKIQGNIEYDGVLKIIFDVFGFSRGAAAARHFVNTIDTKDDHGLVESLPTINGFSFKLGFDWTKREDSRIGFVGIFDTVESAVQDTLLGLSEDCAERVVHLCAGDEYRKNFPLTRITSDVEGRKIAPQFTEVMLPGAHSDVGGGYRSRHSYSANADAAMIEGSRLRYFVCSEREEAGKLHTDNKAYRDALSYAKLKLSEGWGDKIVTKVKGDKSYNDDFAFGEIGLKVKYRFIRRKNYKRKVIHVDVMLKRMVEGELSRIPLHMMFEAGYQAGAPFKEWKESNPDLKLNLKDRSLPIELKGIDSQLLKSACSSGVLDLRNQIDNKKYKLIRRYYCHHSSKNNGFVDGIVNSANIVNDLPVREYLANTPGEES
ncbi:hypothetical protein MED121_11995 [Marinomonas sp. MED121]|uniref:phospholipase effector Tle1 domain-containing protein n=1 Tax=Marinomonas sp. MED121 TaxID=314277 RepID=UPI000069000C|nr:DUF2235 domain-containing protein [Marinomonas sp. MED121]EAQ66645.1 hypothetical protein MED121_11995 [Marinomonas sp. MED121]